MIPLRHDGGRHRRFRLGQIHARARVLYKALELKRTGGSIKEFANASRATSITQTWCWWTSRPSGARRDRIPATYLKAFDAIREVFAATPEAKKRGYTAGPFFVQHSRRALRGLPGRRHRHGGDAVPRRRRADLRGVPRHAIQEQRARSPLPRKEYPRRAAAHGARGLAFFAGVPKVTSKLRILDEVGLGYLRLGQSATTLSGGEAQRLKLAAHLTTDAIRASLYLRRAHHRAALRRHSEAAHGVSQADRRRRFDSGHRAQSRHHQIRGLGDRSWSGRRRTGRNDGCHGHARAGGAQLAFVYGQISFARAGQCARG